MKLPISAIILTYNEEKNIAPCLQSVGDLFEDIFIVDSFSNDKTLEISKSYTGKIYQHEFENYGKQRNWALANLPIKTKWVFHINSDQRITNELKNELLQIFAEAENISQEGLLIPRKTIFMGRWIKYGGHYPVYDAILFKLGYGNYEESRYDQLCKINGKTKVLSGEIEDIVTNSLSDFIFRHNKWSSFQAIDEILGEDQISTKSGIRENLFGNVMERRRYSKGLYMKLPLFVRAFMYFNYRYFVRFGFLDGIEGLIFHFLQGFWFRFLVDAKIYEIKISRKSKTISKVISEINS